MGRIRTASLITGSIAVVGIFTVTYWVAGRQTVVTPPAETKTGAATADDSYSNILPNDYLGPAACAECHQKQFDSWSEHSHRFMNQLPTAKSVKGDFANHVWTIRDGATVTFTTEGDRYVMGVDRRGEPRRRYRVTRTVGSRFMQFYIGLQIEGPKASNDPTYTVEHKLPFAYWFRFKRWVPVDYADIGPPEVLKEGVPVIEGVDTPLHFIGYKQSCLRCHNTYPYAYRLYLQERGFPDAKVQVAMRQLHEELFPSSTARTYGQAYNEFFERLNPDQHLVTLGISCESCHQGGREHARQEKRIRFLPTSPMMQLSPLKASRPITGGRKDPATNLGLCAQCHSASVALYPNGAAMNNSREALDMHAGACVSQIRCVHCHEPHTAGVPSGGPTLAEHVQACLSCHSQYASPAKAAQHSRHTAAQVSCLDCHMPRYTQGLDELVRTHRISAPVEQSMVAAGLPNACSFCHLDKSVRWAVDEVKRGWGRHIDLTPGADLDQPAGPAWLNSPQMMSRLFATHGYARSPLGRKHVSEVLRSLNDPVAAARALAQVAVERLLGRPLQPQEIDLTAPPRDRLRQIEALDRKARRKE